MTPNVLSTILACQYSIASAPHEGFKKIAHDKIISASRSPYARWAWAFARDSATFNELAE
jgi:hypothetical protein